MNTVKTRLYSYLKSSASRLEAICAAALASTIVTIIFSALQLYQAHEISEREIAHQTILQEIEHLYARNTRFQGGNVHIANAIRRFSYAVLMNKESIEEDRHHLVD